MWFLALFGVFKAEIGNFGLIWYDMIWLWVTVDLVPLPPPPQKKENKQNENKKRQAIEKS